MKQHSCSLFRAAFVGLLAFALALAGCNSDLDDGHYLTFRNKVPAFAASGASVTFRFATDEPWRIDAVVSGDNPDGWFEVSPTEGLAGNDIVVVLRVDENPEYAARSFMLTIRTASFEKSFEVVQLGRNAIIAGENRYELSAEAQSLSIGIQANVDYDVEVVEGGEWCVPDPGSRADMGLTEREHRFNVAANTTPLARTAVVEFRNVASELCDRVTVVQAAWLDPDPERTALRAIYDAAGGDDWTRRDNWCGDLPLGEWYGVETDDDGHVIELRLSHNNLRGGIAHEIAQLSRLRVLDLSHNDLDDDLVYVLPEGYEEYDRCDLEALKELEDVDLSHNRLKTPTGRAPRLQYMPSLRKIDLSYNRLKCWISYSSWKPLFSNGRTVDLIFNGNEMHGDVAECIVNHPEWDRLAMQLVRQYYPGGAGLECPPVHVPDFTFTDMRTGARQSIRALCGENELTMILAWDPTDERSQRFAEVSVHRYHTLYGAQGFAVVAILPDGEEYRQAAAQYLAAHDVKWPVVADYADAQGRRLVLPMEPYPSYLLFDREGLLIDDVHNETWCRTSLVPEEPITFDLTEREFQYADYMNKFCYDIFGNCTYESTDYSMDKQVETLQRATVGKGIDIVLMGDVFTDVDIETGYYRHAMELAMETFFSCEPTKTYRDYFNVHMVYAVSKRRQLSNDARDSALSTILWSTNIVGIKENTEKVDRYVEAVSSSAVKIPTVIVNGDERGRFAVFRLPNDTYAYVGLPYGDRTSLRVTLQHESIGHGFGLLGDTYNVLYPGTITEVAKKQLMTYQSNGVFLNLSLTSNPASVPWAHLLGHPRYPEVGIRLGGYGYETGVWNSGIDAMYAAGMEFNPVSRELIVRRILTLAGEEYTFEKFLERDVAPAASASALCGAVPLRPMPDYRHGTPVFIDEE